LLFKKSDQLICIDDVTKLSPLWFSVSWSVDHYQTNSFIITKQNATAPAALHINRICETWSW